MVVFSHYAMFAAFFFLLAILGVYAILRQSGWAALIVVAYPIICLGFMSTQKVMIVQQRSAGRAGPGCAGVVRARLAVRASDASAATPRRGVPRPGRADHRTRPG